MKETLIKKIKKAAITGVAGLGLVGVMSGCQEMTPEETRGTAIAGNMMQSLSPYARDDKTGMILDVMGTGMSTAAQMDYGRQIVRESRPVTNVTVNVPGGNTQIPRQTSIPENVVEVERGTYMPALGYNWVNPNDQKDLRVRKRTEAEESYNSGYFACNYFRDFDGDGLEFDEFFNIKKDFKRNEKITLIGNDKAIQIGEWFKLEILDSNGRTVMLKGLFSEEKTETGFWYSEIAPQELPIGDYTAVFSAQDKYLGRTSFKVIE